MADGGIPVQNSTSSQGGGPGGYVGHWTSLNRLEKFESLTLEMLPFKETTTRAIYSVLRDEKTTKALCLLHLLADGQAYLKNLKSTLNLLSLDNAKNQEDSKMVIWKNGNPIYLGYIKNLTLFYSHHAPILKGYISSSNDHKSLEISDYNFPSVHWATIEAIPAKRHVVIRFVRQNIFFSFKAAIIALAIKHFKTFESEYCEPEKHHTTFDAERFFKYLYREDPTPGVSNAEKIGNPVTDLSIFDNITDLVVRRVRLAKVDGNFKLSVYALRDASDNTPLFLAYPSIYGAYTITNAMSTETVFFTEDYFSRGQKAVLYSWDNGTKYQIGSVERFRLECNAIDFPMAVNPQYFGDGLEAHFTNPKTDKILARNSTIGSENSTLVQIQKDVPSPVKSLIVAYALHRFHEHFSSFSCKDDPQEFNGNHQGLSQEIFAERNLPLLTLTPIPTSTTTEDNPDVSNISAVNKIRIEKAGLRYPILDFYLLYNDQSGKVCHIIEIDRHYGHPRALFRNAGAPQNITFAFESRHAQYRAFVIFNNEQIGIVNNGKSDWILRQEAEKNTTFHFQKEYEDDNVEVIRINIEDQTWGRLIFDNQLYQVTAEFSRDMDIYFRFLIIAFGMKAAMKKRYYQKIAPVVSGLDEVIQIVDGINQ